MKKQVILFSLLAALVFLLATSNVAMAQATRTWVSGVGDDANPCSRTAPCKTFAGAISKTAAGGEIDVLDPGGFGAVTITKAMTIDGGPNAGGILNSGVNGINVSAGVNDAVAIKNLEIEGIGTGTNGIRFLSGASLSLQNVRIWGQAGAGVDFEPGGTSMLFIQETTIENCASHGVLVKPGASGSASGTVTRLQAFKNLTGLRVEDRSNISVINSVASNNANNGFIAVSSSAAANLFIESSIASNNPNTSGGGVAASGASATIRISNMDITNNGNGILSLSSGKILSFGNNKNAGNTTNGAPTGSAGALQ